jgi:hypothetical protein
MLQSQPSQLPISSFGCRFRHFGKRRRTGPPQPTKLPNRDRLTSRANARDLSVSAGVTRAPTVRFGPTARTRIVLRRRGIVGDLFGRPMQKRKLPEQVLPPVH